MSVSSPKERDYGIDDWNYLDASPSVSPPAPVPRSPHAYLEPWPRSWASSTGLWTGPGARVAYSSTGCTAATVSFSPELCPVLASVQRPTPFAVHHMLATAVLSNTKATAESHFFIEETWVEGQMFCVENYGECGATLALRSVVWPGALSN